MPDPKPYEPGSVVRRREVLHGKLWMDHPVTVVADDGDLLAVLLEPGSAFTFHSHPFGEHPWAAHAAWSGPVVLQLYRAGDPYSVWRFHEPDGTFRHWYVNFETPAGPAQGRLRHRRPRPRPGHRARRHRGLEGRRAPARAAAVRPDERQPAARRAGRRPRGHRAAAHRPPLVVGVRRLVAAGLISVLRRHGVLAVAVEVAAEQALLRAERGVVDRQQQVLVVLPGTASKSTFAGRSTRRRVSGAPTSCTIDERRRALGKARRRVVSSPVLSVTQATRVPPGLRTAA